MVQAKAAGEVRDLWEMRKVIANSIELKHFHPKDKAQWDAAYEKFLAVLGKK
jgi:rhamnulokinase